MRIKIFDTLVVIGCVAALIALDWKRFRTGVQTLTLKKAATYGLMFLGWIALVLIVSLLCKLAGFDRYGL